MIINVYRLCERRFAESGKAFLGEGARIAGGRWNPPGMAVVYTSSSLSLCSLEFLVHFEIITSLPDLVAFALQFDEKMVTTVEHLPDDWRRIPSTSSTQEIGAKWCQRLESAVLCVPSTIIPSEKNYILNLAHPDFREIKIGAPTPFFLDPRLLR